MMLLLQLTVLSLIMRGMLERRAALIALSPDNRHSRPANASTEVDGPTLIVAPLSVVQTWADQVCVCVCVLVEFECDFVSQIDGREGMSSRECRVS